MQKRRAPFGTYLLLEPWEWTDDTPLPQFVERAVTKGRMHGFAVKIVAFMICEELRISVAMFPASQREPTLAQVERMFRTCSRPDYPGFTSVDVISWFPATEPQPS